MQVKKSSLSKMTIKAQKNNRKTKNLVGVKPNSDRVFSQARVAIQEVHQPRQGNTWKDKPETRSSEHTKWQTQL